jgi:hypothetical protein
VLEDILRQHAEQAAFLWTVYDHHLLHPEENEEMDAERLARLVERLEAHLDGLRVAGEDGRRIAGGAVFAEYPEAGELFVRADASAGGGGAQGDGSRPRAGAGVFGRTSEHRQVNSAASHPSPSKRATSFSPAAMR